MIKVIIHGCNGAMGREVADLIGNEEDFEIVAGVDVSSGEERNFPVVTSLDECPEADVIIDFSTAKAVDGLIDYCGKTVTPVVLCTTGLSEDQIDAIGVLSEKCAVLRSANMSLGINLLMKVLAEVAPTLAAAGFDIEILEKHHNRKIDAPSGTAIALANAMNESLDNSYHYRYDRSSTNEKRDPKEIGIQSLRMGTLPGEHEVIFAGQDEVITFGHTAYSRSIFANGAIQAARFLCGRGPGLYDMADVIG